MKSKDQMTGEELRADALQNGFVLDDSTIDDGFDSVAELHDLFANADISTPEKLAALERWQVADRTKAGLLKLQPVPATDQKPGMTRERRKAKFTTHEGDLKKVMTPSKNPADRFKGPDPRAG